MCGVGAAGAATQPTGATVGEFGRFTGQFAELAEPLGVTAGDNGTFCVAEADADRLRVFDVAGGELAVATPGLLAPAGVARWGDLIYVADTGNHRIVVLDDAFALQRAWGRPGSSDGAFLRPGAVAVDDRRVYVADTGNDRVQVFDRAGQHELTIGQRGTAPGQFRQPVGIAVAPDGDLYVVDADNHRVQRFDPEGRVRQTWGGWGSPPGLFAAPSGLDVHAGIVYVADRLNHRIQAFDPFGSFLYQWGLHAVVPREGDGRIHYPNGVAVSRADDDTLVVAEAFENRCQIFGRVVEDDGSTVPKRSLPPRSIQSHFGKLITSDGDLVAVWEPESRGVLVFHLEREVPILITTFGSYGDRFGQFGRISCLHLDGTTLYVGDAANDRIQTYRIGIDDDWRLRYDPALARLVRAIDLKRLGSALAEQGEPSRIVPLALEHDGDGNLIVLDGHLARVLVFDAEYRLVGAWGGYGTDAGRLRGPTDLAVSPDGERLYVADALGSAVRVFDRRGSYLFSVPSPGDEAPFVRPSGLAVGPDGTVYVSDAARDRVVSVSPDGAVLGAFGATGVESGELWKPHGLATDGRGRVFVLDFGNHRVQIFSSAGQWEVTFSASRADSREQSESSR